MTDLKVGKAIPATGGIVKNKDHLPLLKSWIEIPAKSKQG